MNSPELAARLAGAFRQARATQSSPQFQSRLAERREEEREARTRALRSGWNAPRRHVAALPCRDGPWGEKLRAIESKLGRGVLIGLVGVRGTGKTQLAVELMKRVTADGRGALFRTAMELLMRLKQSYRKDASPTEIEIIREHRRPSLLVIDEFARRGETEWENNVLFELLNQRYGDLTDSLLIVNQTPVEFETSLGPSIVSRMQEGGGIIECAWPSFR